MPRDTPPQFWPNLEHGLECYSLLGRWRTMRNQGMSCTTRNQGMSRTHGLIWRPVRVRYIPSGSSGRRHESDTITERKYVRWPSYLIKTRQEPTYANEPPRRPRREVREPEPPVAADRRSHLGGTSRSGRWRTSYAQMLSGRSLSPSPWRYAHHLIYNLHAPVHIYYICGSRLYDRSTRMFDLDLCSGQRGPALGTLGGSDQTTIILQCLSRFLGHIGV